ncbi:hypothetical protein ACB098_05G043300 [Castanea mollissima]|uniref:Uncharacterized protein n=1 Tax=Castanea mollissima TaxID=60419 RepID=A0A8J4RML8_9ROSI|nr:hypothetical protein CMV_009395 [Castanea mollissima]
MLYMANICCSIETEPKTLNRGQLNLAREVAADVVEKMEPNEASTVFNEKLRPSFQIKDQEREKEEKELHEPVEKGDIIERPCQCLCPTATVESPDQTSLKEPLSAPF